MHFLYLDKNVFISVKMLNPDFLNILYFRFCIVDSFIKKIINVYIFMFMFYELVS